MFDLPDPFGPDHDGHARGELEHGLVREGLEPSKGQRAQEHLGPDATGAIGADGHSERREIPSHVIRPADSRAQNPRLPEPVAPHAGVLSARSGSPSRRSGSSSTTSTQVTVAHVGPCGTSRPWRRRRRAGPRTRPRPARRAGSAPTRPLRAGRLLAGRPPEADPLDVARHQDPHALRGHGRIGLSSGTAGSSSCPGPGSSRPRSGSGTGGTAAPLRPYTFSSLPRTRPACRTGRRTPRPPASSPGTGSPPAPPRASRGRAGGPPATTACRDIRSHRSPAANSTSSE